MTNPWRACKQRKIHHLGSVTLKGKQGGVQRGWMEGVALWCRERQLEATRSAAQRRRAEEDAEEDRVEEEARQQRLAEEEAARQAEEARVKVMCNLPCCSYSLVTRIA